MDTGVRSFRGKFAFIGSLRARADYLLFWALAVKRMKGYIAGLLTLAVSLLIAVFVYGMPAEKAVDVRFSGSGVRLLPIGWIIVTSVFLYKNHRENRTV
ncbi:L-lactate permease [Bacillus velezensis]|uniref:L-lactate permease n=1 Tax=Bacillus velezensis TaxID=492670 RepID=UPI0023B25D48|nr:L-lactate permease [Bacillus velezensis]